MPGDGSQFQSLSFRLPPQNDNSDVGYFERSARHLGVDGPGTASQGVVTNVNKGGSRCRPRQSGWLRSIPFIDPLYRRRLATKISHEFGIPYSERAGMECVSEDKVL